ncbi:hypothetical protein [Novosphingobium album (ex Liu et al. 2023)]|uniref:Uncharacterized protein n=1 Tax=Novosphingobium album (ex Liu et al. 2023) TaxID=3031130 RepID=A0ABT5WSJ7_9SPHN|nr:hypothetical protein [Novosphingobium album (ex Liu et al. 2023)]MDE8653013.1 hypothetical protein [Novosphingobium album (ex Liu et al. 2023)]
MRNSSRYLLAAAGVALLGAGVAQAATAGCHTTQVALPDGAVAQVRYTGDIAPKVAVLPADAMTLADFDPLFMPMPAAFARMQQFAAMMDQQAQAMLQQAAAGGAAAPGLVMAGNLPQGAHFSYVSTTTDASGCTRTVSYNSDGSGAAPKMTQAASDGCDAANPGGAAIPAKVEASGSVRAMSGQKT